MSDDIVAAQPSEVDQWTASSEIESLMAVLARSPDGEYHIPGIRFSDRTPEVVKLHNMMSRLSRAFPNYTWITADSLFPQDTGITVRWRKKFEISVGQEQQMIDAREVMNK